MKVTDVTGGEFVKGETITGGTSGATAKIVTDGTIRYQLLLVVSLQRVVSTQVLKDKYQNQLRKYKTVITGKITLVIKVGESLKVWKDDFKRTMHSRFQLLW